MDANIIWARLDTTLREHGLTDLVSYAELTDVEDYWLDGESHCPNEDEARALLPESFRRFVAAYRCPAIEPSGVHEDAVRFVEFLPYRKMCWATGTMGHPGRQWTDVRAERDRGEYRWEYVMFAAFDAADGCGWAFWPAADEPGGSDEPQVWYVEDSLPEEQVGTFAEWLDGVVADTLTGLASMGLVDAPSRPAG